MRRISLARQLLAMQVLVVAIAVAIAGVVAVRAAQDARRDEQRQRVLSVAEALAASNEARRAVAQKDSRTLQPIAERARRNGDLGFVVFMTPDGIRLSHPDRSQIGRHFVGTIAPAQQGRALTEVYTGTLGRSVRAVVPIRDGRRVVGLVSVGVLESTIAAQLRRQLPELIATLALALAAGIGLSLLLARRVRRQTHGLDPDELAAVYEHHAAVLHAIREGVVVVGPDERLRLVNDEARRLLGLPADAVGRPLTEVVADAELRDVLRGASDRGVVVVGDRVLVSGRGVGEQGEQTVTTLRDRTEIEEVVRELGTVSSLADALRAQAHESANELHTVVGLVELGRYDDAVAFATRRITVTQDEVDLVQQRIREPGLAALLLAKAAVCRERGVHLAVDPESDLPAGAAPSEDLVTIAGNLVDNALDALGAQRGGRIDVLARASDAEVLLQVRDDGPGLPDLERVFEPGWSTKPERGSGRRGLGLALVSATVKRLDGSVEARNEGGAVICVRLPLAVTAR
ncbi:MAG TPA: ATP-binding protein [Solirubrobacteraceae bacterium]